MRSLIVTRYRTELSSGADPRGAASIAMATAGRSVVFAGVTVVISLLGMLMMSQPYVAGVAFSAVADRSRGDARGAHAAARAARASPAATSTDSASHSATRPKTRPVAASGTGGAGLSNDGPWCTGLAGAAGAGSADRACGGPAPRLPGRRQRPDRISRPDAAYDLMTDGFGAGFNGAFVLVADGGDDAALATLADLRSDARGRHPESPRCLRRSPSPNGDAAVITLTPATSPQDPATDATS